MKRRFGWMALAGLAGVVAAVALVGAQANKRNMRWYHRLKKPPFNPPDWIFGPVWTGLYALMVGSAYRVWQLPPSPARTRALALWGGQLAANAAWTPLFFEARRPRAALVDIGLLLAGLGAYVNEARKIDKKAAWMMAPYVGWSMFATALNEEIVRRNEDVA
jgi:benzodiazapine receptor